MYLFLWIVQLVFIFNCMIKDVNKDDNDEPKIVDGEQSHLTTDVHRSGNNSTIPTALPKRDVLADTYQTSSVDEGETMVQTEMKAIQNVNYKRSLEPIS